MSFATGHDIKLSEDLPHFDHPLVSLKLSVITIKSILNSRKHVQEEAKLTKRRLLSLEAPSCLFAVEMRWDKEEMLCECVSRRKRNNQQEKKKNVPWEFFFNIKKKTTATTFIDRQFLLKQREFFSFIRETGKWSFDKIAVNEREVT